MALGTRAISRIEGSASGGFSNTKKMVDLFISTNTNDAGEISNPAVYDSAIEMLEGYNGTIDGQNLIADYNNKKKKLETKKNKSETTVASLREKEYSSWYIDDDGADDTSFRNPAWVAQVTSESLDMIVAETVDAILQAEENGDETADLNSYLNGLITRSDRMRTVATSLEEGDPTNLDGYGYFVDSDPSTGEIRGASFMPTDADFGGISSGKKRTNSTINVGNKQVPVYAPFVTDDQGVDYSTLGGVRYEDDGELLYASDKESVALTDRNSYQGVNSKIALGQMYESFSGKVNIDGSYKKNYVYVANDNSVYKFADDDPKGQQFISSMREAGVVGDSFPRLNPSDVSGFMTEPLPDDSSQLTYSAGRNAKISRYQQEAAASQAESDRLNNRTGLQEVAQEVGGFFSDTASKVGGFFSRKNEPNKPDEAGQTVNGQTSAPEVISQGQQFFRNKVT